MTPSKTLLPLRRSATAALAALLWLAPPTFSTEEGGQDDSCDSTEVSSQECRVALVLEERLLVEESLPFAPTSNTIATKLPVPLALTPAHVGVVSADLLIEQGAEVLGDALAGVSGVNAQTGNGVFDLFIVRGFDSTSSGLVLTDGAPEPEATFYQMYNTERVEVFKGPAGFLYGSNPLAAAVNLVRKQPTPTSFGIARLAGGSFDTTEAQIDLNQPLGGDALTFRLNGIYRERGGYRDATDSEVIAVNPVLGWRPDDRTSLHFNVELASSDFLPDGGLPLVGGELLSEIDRKRSYGSPFDFSEQDITRFQVDVEHQVSDRLTLRNKSYLRGLDWESTGTLMSGVFPNPFAGGRLTLARTLTALDDDQSFLGNQSEVVWSLDTGSIQHRFLFGLEIARLEDEYTLDVAILPFMDLLAPVETASEPLFFLPSQHQAGNSTTEILAPYFIDQMALSEHWQLLLGARFDRIEFEDSVRGDSRSDDELSPLVGLVYSPNRRFSIYANSARSFAPPSARVVGERQPEESQQIEIGARHELWGGRGTVSVALFEIVRDNIAIADDNGFTQQIGDQEAQGLELEFRARLSDQTRATFVYAYTDSTLTRFSELVPTGSNPPFLVFDRSGNRSALSPEHLATLWVSHHVGSWVASLGARYVDDQFLAEDNAAEIDAYSILDASLIYSLPRWRFSLHLDNLADTEYESRGFGSNSAIPGSPFGARLGVEVRF